MKKRVLAYGVLAVIVIGVLTASFIYSENSNKQNLSALKRSEENSAKIIAENPKEIAAAEPEAQPVVSTPPVTTAPSSRAVAAPAPAPKTPSTPEEIKAAARAALDLGSKGTRPEATLWSCFDIAVRLVTNHNAGFGGWGNYSHIMKAVEIAKPMKDICSVGSASGHAGALAANIITASCAHDETKPNRPLLAPLTCKWD